MFSRLLILGLILSGANALAQSRIDVFRWRVNGTFDVQAHFDGARVSFSDKDQVLDESKGEKPGLLEFDGSATVRKAPYTGHIKSYRGFVSIIVSKDGGEFGQLFMLERKNSAFEQMNAAPILGRVEVMPEDLGYALKRFSELKRIDGKEPSFAFRTMVSYFENWPERKLDAFADDVEKGVEVVKVVPKPDSKMNVQAGPNIKPLPSRQAEQALPSMGPNGAPPMFDQNGMPMDPNVDPNYAQGYPGYQPPQQPQVRRRRQPPPQGPMQIAPQWGQQPGYDPSMYPPQSQQPPRRQRQQQPNTQAIRPPADIPSNAPSWVRQQVQENQRRTTTTNPGNNVRKRPRNQDASANGQPRYDDTTPSVQPPRKKLFGLF
ncbi:MAG: hypothetical protein KF799_03825 [Bdellovibrionales bacterium]|nr:hypothetical protein [Bdellovibrionales bacterium]